MFGALRLNSALPEGDEDYAEDHRDEQGCQHDQFIRTNFAGGTTQLRGHILPQVEQGFGHLGQDTSHDQQADPVADTVFIDLLTEPHQEHGPAGHDGDGGQLPAEMQGVGPWIAELRGNHTWRGRHHDILEIHPALNDAQHDGQDSACIR